MASRARMRAGEDSASAVADGPLAAGWRWLWQAPEVAAVLGKHVEAAAADDAQVLSATALSIIAAGQLGRGLAVVDDALAALDAAEAGEHLEIGWLLRLELAGAAKALRLPRIGMRALADVLTSATRPSIVGAALVRGHSLLAGRCGHRSELAEVLAIAEKCYRGDDRVDDDVAALLRAAVRVEMARWHRRVGELGAAISAAGEGLGLLSTLRHADLDSGKIRALLTLELVLALLDSGRSSRALAVAEPVLRAPSRAPAAATRGWLAHALAVRVHLPAQRVDQAIALLVTGCDDAQRHGLVGVVAACQLALAEVHETAGHPADALGCLRAAQAARRADERLRSKARCALVERFSARVAQPDALVDQLARWASSAGSNVASSATLSVAERVPSDDKSIDTGNVDVAASIVTVPDARTAADDRAVSPTRSVGDSSEPPMPVETAMAASDAPERRDAVAVPPQTRSAPDDEPAQSTPAQSTPARSTPAQSAAAQSTPAGADAPDEEQAVENQATPTKSAGSPAIADVADVSGGSPARRSGPRHGVDAPDRIALSDVPGLVVAEGSGGRRRAPESGVEPVPLPAEQVDVTGETTTSAEHAGAASHAQPPATPTRSTGEKSDVEDRAAVRSSTDDRPAARPDPEFARPVPRLADLLADALLELRKTQHAAHYAAQADSADPLRRNGSSRRNGVEHGPGRPSDTDQAGHPTDADDD